MFMHPTVMKSKKAAKELGLPVIVKPIMSSSGKGQSFIRKEEDIELAWELALKKARGVSSRVIVEEFLEFDFEITLLTIRQKDGSTLFCPPIGHEQKKWGLSIQLATCSNYRESTTRSTSYGKSCNSRAWRSWNIWG